ncbi:MAG: hypothetical protein IKO74_01905 [Selenomonadaceae bacterium]|nr:hypothetical protein [Selenomonadaceae bacterium]
MNILFISPAVVIRDGRALANRYFLIYQHALIGAFEKFEVDNAKGIVVYVSTVAENFYDCEEET